MSRLPCRPAEFSKIKTKKRIVLRSEKNFHCSCCTLTPVSVACHADQQSPQSSPAL
jgi:hypothetical protein